MDVILLERVKGLGIMGDVVKVKDGYARNFLFPRNKAMRANDDNKKVFENQKKIIEAQNLDRLKDAKSVATKIENKIVNVIRQAGESGHLYGSVNARDIVDAINKGLGINLDKTQILLHNPIKAVGIHLVELSLHSDLVMDIKVNVARSDEEAEKQANPPKKREKKSTDASEEVEAIEVSSAE